MPKKKQNYKKIIYFFLAGLKALPLHFLHLTLPPRTLRLVVLTFDLQSLQTKILSKILAAASGNLPIIINPQLITLYLF
ncbi:hypothetical protein K9L97_04215 [Candidatus Woesearchaeota archaeon]|nr:hypothetical protein [Candidatus Woesearchaeota archaeon]